MAINPVITLCLISTIALLGVSAQPIAFDPETQLAEFELDIEGFEPVPIRIQRVKRQELITDLKRTDAGTRGTVGVGGTLYNNGDHRLDGQATVSKTWDPKGPTSAGGRLDYMGPRGAGASLGVDHTRHQGTNLDARGTYNLFTSPDRRTTIDSHGGYQRSYGGPFGNSRPNWNVGVGLNHRF